MHWNFIYVGLGGYVCKCISRGIQVINCFLRFKTMSKDDTPKDPTKVEYSEEEQKDPIAVLAKEIKRLRKKIKKLRNAVRGVK
jgi:hypothetical protein